MSGVWIYEGEYYDPLADCVDIWCKYETKINQDNSSTFLFADILYEMVI